ncbi:MAG: UvrD-helicase domain-containing protein, partial [Flavobacteriales bacterium]
GIVAKEPAPFIYERLGENYRHFLVDEFQDTSVLQWMNLLPLLHNGLSGGHESFVVGDAKQAIYRFRSGEVEQFIRLPKIKGASENPLLREREKCLEDNIGVDHLKYNYRSCREIVEFNNHLFGQLHDKLSGELKKVYADHKQEARREGGYVSVEIISESADDPLPHLSRSLEIVQELIEDGFMQGEIAILVRSNNDGAEMACFLMEQGINVVSTDSLKLGSSQKAGCVIALLRVLSDAADAALRCAALTQLEKAGLLKMELHEAVARCMAGNELKGFESLLAESDMPFCISDLSSLPLTEQTESLIRLLGFARTPDPFLLGLLECVQEFSTRFNTGLHAFLDRWDSNYCKSNIALSASDDAVRVLTIHKAKGLEFPAVIIPKASWVKNTGKDRKWVSYRDDNLKELNSIAININKGLKETDFDAYFNEELNLIELDNINLLYVACTRPSERLYVISKKAVGNNISENIVPAIEKHPLWNKEAQRLLLGEKARHAKQPDEDKSDTEIAAMPSAPWQGRIHIAAGR